MSYDPNNPNHYKWWLSSTNDLHQDVFAVVNKLEKDQGYRSEDNLTNARLYGDAHLRGLGAYAYTRMTTSDALAHRVTLNVIQSLIDTVVSKITKSKVRPQFLTDDGNWGLQSRAKKLTKFMDGIFSATEMYSKASMAFLDSCIFGTGALKIFKCNGNIKVERVFIDEIKVSDVESYYGEPRQMHQVKYIHKDVLKEMFPSKAVLIDQATNVDDMYPNISSYYKTDDMIKTIESWHLPSGPNAKDGKHSICINNITLLDETYTKDYFPFVFFRWNLRPMGFFGFGLAEQLRGVQLEINKILRTIQVSMHLVSVPKLLVEASSKIVSAHLNNKIGGIIKYAGTPPAYSPLGGVPGELFSHLDRLYQKAYEISGVSQLSAQSLKPSGLDSGKALREYNDIESERFLSVSTRYEKAFVDAAKIAIDIAKELYEDDKDYKVQVKGKDFIETIKWSEVDLQDDQFMMDVYPASALSKTPAGRLQDVQDLMQAGFVDRDTALKLLDFPDVEGTMNLLTSDTRNLDKLIENMVEKGKYFPPEPYQNLENAIRKVQQAYLLYRMRGAPEERLELLRRYMEDAQGLLMKAQEQAPTAAQQAEELAAAGAPGAAQMVAEQANLGAEPLNPLVEGALPLTEGEVTEAQQADLLNEAALDTEQELTDEELAQAQEEGLI